MLAAASRTPDFYAELMAMANGCACLKACTPETGPGVLEAAIAYDEARWNGRPGGASRPSPAG